MRADPAASHGISLVDLCSKIGVRPNTIRRWRQLGLISPAYPSERGRAPRYSEADVIRARMIYALRAEARIGLATVRRCLRVLDTHAPQD